MLQKNTKSAEAPRKMKSHPRRILFVTYYRLVPTGQIGIFKRSIRLINELPPEYDVHVLNFGPLPEEDPLFEAVRRRAKFYTAPHQDTGNYIEDLFRRLSPRCLIFGETPLGGRMRLSSRIGRYLGLPQIALENFYGDLSFHLLNKRFSRIKSWMMLGLLAEGRPSHSQENLEIVPPLVKFPEGETPERDRICIIGYDQQTLSNGIDLLERLPGKITVDVFTTKKGEKHLNGKSRVLQRANAKLWVLPPDAILYSAMQRSKMIFGKAGFQQVVEAILLGTPIICQACGGGLEMNLVPEYLKPYVRVVHNDRELNEAMFDVMFWLGRPPELPWMNIRTAIPDPFAFGAERLLHLVEQL